MVGLLPQLWCKARLKQPGYLLLKKIFLYWIIHVVGPTWNYIKELMILHIAQ